jgi:hypothetical protein
LDLPENSIILARFAEPRLSNIDRFLQKPTAKGRVQPDWGENAMQVSLQRYCGQSGLVMRAGPGAVWPQRELPVH